jgi:hypothetical protein
MNFLKKGVKKVAQYENIFKKYQFFFKDMK